MKLQRLFMFGLALALVFAAFAPVRAQDTTATTTFTLPQTAHSVPNCLRVGMWMGVLVDYVAQMMKPC